MKNSQITDSYKIELVNLLRRADRVLSDNKVEYFAVYGTCLGAVRHHGIIPWDGDVDIAVRRRDVVAAVKALRASREQLYVEGADLALRGKAWKLRIFNRMGPNPTLEFRRAYLDLYIIDSAEASKLLFTIRQVLASGLFAASSRRRKTNSKTKKTTFHVLLDFVFLPFRILPARMVRDIAIWVYCSTRRSTMVKLSGMFRRRYPAECFSSQQRVQFHDLMIPVPNGYDGFLTVMYGNWREPPPVEKRGNNTFAGENGEWNVAIPPDEERMIITGLEG